MATDAFFALANLTLSVNQATVTFSSISSAYRDLRVITQTTSTTAGGGYVRFNNDSGANYNSNWAYGYGTTTQASAGAGTTSFQIAEMLDGNLDMSTWEILDANVIDKHKTVMNRASSPLSGGVGAYALVGRYASTGSVTSIVFGATTGAFAAGSTFALYGRLA